ncbi:hypothetical protein LUW76_28820 [Actinomadura madurae]|uniref:hypothetical protein n=1 Tax=Actinomadura madurae TaxID=1993 RepID=UPI002026CD7E|nr:hypothetical protein [Actinomadura madurae]URM98045.1 hypothetical protein LUW76_28820 [Actinomadura madurae]
MVKGRRPCAGVAGLALACAAAAPVMVTPASAADGAASRGVTYQATLEPLNHQNASGSLTLRLDGRRATIDEHFEGLTGTSEGMPYPHLQHIRGGGRGDCPTTAADENGDGVVSATEAAPFYGPVQTTLSVKGSTSAKAGSDVENAPTGAETDYTRVTTLDAATRRSLRAGTAVVVVHGVDPALLRPGIQKKPSDILPSLSLAATSPVLCGVLRAMPDGGAVTGTGSTAAHDAPSKTVQGAWVLGGAVAMAAVALLVRFLLRRRGRTQG